MATFMILSEMVWYFIGIYIIDRKLHGYLEVYMRFLLILTLKNIHDTHSLHSDTYIFLTPANRNFLTACTTQAHYQIN